jgi:hypothetical protein
VTSDATCDECGTALSLSENRCPLCGGTVTHTLKPSGSGVTVETTSPALHGEGRSAEGAETVLYRSSAGAQSNSRLSGDTVHVTVSGPIEVGTRGEGEVVGILRSTMAMMGRAVSQGGPASNRYDDKWLTVNGERVAVQVVTVPPSENYWSEVAAAGSASTDVPVSLAARWVHEALKGKASHYGPECCGEFILALDCRFAAVVSSRAVVESYLGQFGDPTLALGFGAVWLVGPRESRCTQLGSGKW